MEYTYKVKITQPYAPGTFEEALKLPDAELWRTSAKNEMDSVEDLQVYKLDPRSTVPPGTRTYKTRWVFKFRTGNTHAARFVVGGWGQVPNKDCSNTYVPVCRLQSFLMVLGIAEMDWEGVQPEVKNCFPVRGHREQGVRGSSA